NRYGFAKRRIGAESDGRSAHADAPTNQAFANGRSTENVYRNRARRFTLYCHALGIAAESGDILLNPLQAGNHVENAVVAGYMVRSLGAELGMRQKTEGAQSIRNRNDDHAFLSQPFAVIQLLGRCARNEA